MKERFNNKAVLITGANGGLGSAFASAFAAEGAKLILSGRNIEALKTTASNLQGAPKIFPLDFTDAASHTALREFVIETYGKVDVIINAVGADVRKPLDDHTPAEIQTLLNSNLHGAILLTQAFLPHMRRQNEGAIIHVGGFADGRLAFPFYSVDVATRAGLFSFIESVNRELALNHSKVNLGYFSPSPADTAAERPFHPIWREMGVKILPVETIAQELLTMIEKRRNISIMGGFSTKLFAGINSISPKMADAILLKKYGQTLKKYLVDDSASSSPASASWTLWLGTALIVLSTLLYGGLFVLPFLSITGAMKLTVTPFLILFGELTFWIGGALLGKEVVTRYKKYLNPCNWFSKSTAS